MWQRREEVADSTAGTPFPKCLPLGPLRVKEALGSEAGLSPRVPESLVGRWPGDLVGWSASG